MTSLITLRQTSTHAALRLSPALMCKATSLRRSTFVSYRNFSVFSSFRDSGSATLTGNEGAPIPTIPQDEKLKDQTLQSSGSGKEKTSLMKPDKHNYFTEAAWPHPIYTVEQMKAIDIAHREARTFSDKVALAAIRVLRRSFDIATGYSHPKPGQEGMSEFRMTGERWLTRFVFLESIAGVPGMVGGMVRHLHSLRALRRDRAWIETLLEEAYNERMHLLTFLKLSNPRWFMRFMLLGGQGVFFNLFFACYLISPRTCHRFVGYLEEEAIVTYTRCLQDIHAGRLPEWQKLEVPDIAKQYWKMGDNCTMEDLILYIRADEAKHREVNHTFGNLDQKIDRNPFALKIDNGRPQPTKGLQTIKSTGWERDEISA
ncbi:alternative oxidase-domain-containing protein [Lipomyces tetrasporus]|uniref:Alternative oxidase n=1 Tax=Lipomyces tetrasporus TaxID=54092 RepID=A0AAD7VU02_9ASCO|nr:alternative oxidase-domain-containing protein [Lipomyces tetrasporus]KAJ8101289.1 alternative oxidase-domain-containing protein [Lipomyces tetrasporus]